MYFFHYTSEDNHQTMTLGTPWNCEARQPQKGVWYSDQHEVGFYVTALAPSQMTETKARKTGPCLAARPHARAGWSKC